MSASLRTQFAGLDGARRAFMAASALPRHCANEVCVEFLRWETLVQEGCQYPVPQGSLVDDFRRCAGRPAPVSAEEAVSAESFAARYVQRFGVVPSAFWRARHVLQGASERAEANPGSLTADANPGSLAVDANPGSLTVDANPGSLTVDANPGSLTVDANPGSLGDVRLPA